jgi:hypothetical protein
MCGFFPGVLWQLHALTGKQLWADKAQLWQQKIANNQREFITQHDFGELSGGQAPMQPAMLHW